MLTFRAAYDALGRTHGERADVESRVSPCVTSRAIAMSREWVSPGHRRAAGDVRRFGAAPRAPLQRPDRSPAGNDAPEPPAGKRGRPRFGRSARGQRRRSPPVLAAVRHRAQRDGLPQGADDRAGEPAVGLREGERGAEVLCLQPGSGEGRLLPLRVRLSPQPRDGRDIPGHRSRHARPHPRPQGRARGSAEPPGRHHQRDVRQRARGALRRRPCGASRSTAPRPCRCGPIS